MKLTDFDVLVVGAGHAGCEAALASQRMGLHTAAATLDIHRIAHLPCNCSFGGPAKGQLVREIDALGGQMALNADICCTHVRRVGTSKGPAIQTLRVHVDTVLYPQLMRRTLAEAGVTVMQAEVLTLIADEGLWRVGFADGSTSLCGAVVVTSGTFLNGITRIGDLSWEEGRSGEPPARGLSDSLRQLNLNLGRFKTGTTARINKHSVDWDQLIVTPSEPDCPPFSNELETRPNIDKLLPCWQTRTTERTHQIIRDNLTRSSLFGGFITGVGPRYCPSIEDKIVRFPDKLTHPIFLEQESWQGDELYVQGASTSLPADVQLLMLQSMPGLEHVEIMKPGYAVEYDMIYPDQLTPYLQSKAHPGLFFAGQVNGTSGYEEAAAQGLLAGINAARYLQKESPVVITRQQAYIGVLVDDLVTKGVQDPYRMLTSRAEYRLSLRHDNADMRLSELGHEIGLLSTHRTEKWQSKYQQVLVTKRLLQSVYLSGQDNPRLIELGIAPVHDRTPFMELLRRPEVELSDLIDWWPEGCPTAGEALDAVLLNNRYHGYIKMQQRQMKQHIRHEQMPIAEDFDYQAIPALSYETREKLSRIKPLSVGQASRVPGVRPSDIAVLMVWLKRQSG
ncbi:MAG: tRNA uridine-5-carboxymethylaminomethyl(34) synthesis enzyme MnmG [Armatimonadota bacterium]